MDKRVPAEAFLPGEYIRDELEARDWTQADLAFILGRPLQSVNEIISGKKAVTPDTAKGLGDAFGTSAEFWMNLESAYRLAQAPDGSGEVAKRAELYSLAPIKEMVKRGWINKPSDMASLETDLLRFFEQESLADVSRLCFAARMSVPYAELSPAHRAWVARARRLARAVMVAPFDRASLKQGLADLRQLAANEHDIRRVPRLLADLGVRLVVVEHLPRTRIDGAALWLDKPGTSKRTPVVAISLRYDRIDSFWFTLYHELMHIWHEDEPSLDESLVGLEAIPTAEKPEFEQRADREAADLLVPSSEIEKFILRVRPLYSKKKIIQFATRIGIHPGIVVGQLQRRDEVGYGHSREMLVKVRSSLKEAALSDGWGDTPPVT